MFEKQTSHILLWIKFLNVTTTSYFIISWFIFLRVLSSLFETCVICILICIVFIIFSYFFCVRFVYTMFRSLLNNLVSIVLKLPLYMERHCMFLFKQTDNLTLLKSWGNHRDVSCDAFLNVPLSLSLPGLCSIFW